MIIPTQEALVAEAGAVTLPRYAQIIGYTECAFFGVERDNQVNYACRPTWTLAQRREIAKYLLEAQATIEGVLGYPVMPRWVADDEHPYRCPVLARWGHIIEPGVKATAMIQAGVAVDHTNDPATVEVATSVTDTNQLHVYHPGTEVEIYPSAITIEGGIATIRIPRCRMVKQGVGDAVAYDDTANFEATVDVVRLYNDPSTQALLVSSHACGRCGSGGCATTTETACLTIRNAQVGVLDVRPAAYSEGTWRGTVSCTCPHTVRLFYRAGLAALPQQLEDAIVRLAHSLMPAEPCGCEVVQSLWQRDRKVPELLTRERINCPFGMSDGAWIAWRFAQRARLVRAGVM